MRITGSLLAFTLLVAAGEPVDDQTAKEALRSFEEAFKATKDVGAKQGALYALHDVPHDLVLRRLEKALREREPAVRQVAALAIGGQHHDPKKAGQILLKLYKKDFDTEEVVMSALEGMAELNYMGYWPEVKPAMKDERNAVVIRVLDLLGTNRDFRALPELLEMYKVAMPKRVSWTTGTVTVDTGAAGDADQKAAEAAWTAKYGQGGSKAKAKAKAKARAFDERNFDSQIRKCVKQITGQDFDNAMDFEAWYVDNYVACARQAAELDGADPDKAAARAEAELPERKRAFEEEVRKLEEELAKAQAEQK